MYFLQTLPVWQKWLEQKGKNTAKLQHLKTKIEVMS